MVIIRYGGMFVVWPSLLDPIVVMTANISNWLKELAVKWYVCVCTRVLVCVFVYGMYLCMRACVCVYVYTFTTTTHFYPIYSPFLFPFECRQMLFYSISFDRDRALLRLQVRMYR